MTDRLPPYAQLLLDRLRLPRLTTIVDVGANPINTPSYAPLLAAEGCRVVGFEPQPSAFAELAGRNSPQETYLPHAVGDGAPHTLHVSPFSGLTSILPPHAPGMLLIGHPRWRKVNETIPLETVALDAMADLPEFDLLKIDIQGGEGLAIGSAERVLKTAVCVIVELRYLRLYQDEPMMGGVDCELRRQGFELHRFMFNKSAMIANSQASRLRPRRVADQLVDGDAVYLRDLTRIESYGTAQLGHLAVLAATAFESHSVVIHCLDELVRRGEAAADLPASYVDRLPARLKR